MCIKQSSMYYINLVSSTAACRVKVKAPLHSPYKVDKVDKAITNTLHPYPRS